VPQGCKLEMKDQQMKFENLLAMLGLEQPGAQDLAVGSWEETHSLTQPMVAEHLGFPSQS
jgi:hypothetical protein